jgi:hypothetical protein
MQTRESLLSTVRALLEMTEAHGCTKAEAAVASAKAFELMYKHGVSLKELTLQAPSRPMLATPAPAPTRAKVRTPFRRRAKVVAYSFAVCLFGLIAVPLTAPDLHPGRQALSPPVYKAPDVSSPLRQPVHRQTVNDRSAVGRGTIK